MYSVAEYFRRENVAGGARGFWIKLQPCFLLPVLLYFASALLGSRLSELFGSPSIATGQRVLFLVTLGASVLLPCLQRRLIPLLVGILILAAGLFVHGFCSFYQPALAPGGTIQDYQVADTVSANWSLGVAKLYIKQFFGHLLIALPLFFLFPRRLADTVVKVTFLLSFAVNLSVGYIQRFVDIQFLGKGSGNAVWVGRAAGLLEDSGASSVYFAILTCCCFGGALGASNQFWRVVWTISFLCGALLGVSAEGRIFVLALAAGVGATSLIYLLDSRQGLVAQKNVLLLAGSTLSVLIFYCLRYAKLTWSSLSNSISTGNIWDFSGWFERVDPVRYHQYKAMLLAFFSHLVTGTGLGGFHGVLRNYFLAVKEDAPGFLDWSGSFYLDILSSLGIAGVFVLSLFFLVMLANMRRVEGERDFFYLAGTVAAVVSLAVGVHFIFSSFSLLLGIFLARGLSLRNSRFNRLIEVSYGASLFWLGAAMIVLWITATPISTRP